jgi:outer membrane protein
MSHCRTVVLALLLLGTDAAAESGVTLSLGIASEADYPGSDDAEVSPAASLVLRRDDWTVEGNPRSLRATYRRGPALRFGGGIRRRGGRDDVADPVVARLDPVPATVEGLAFARGRLGPVGLGIDVAADLLGETDGFVVELGASLPLPVGERLRVTPGIAAFWADAAFSDAVFGVGAAEGARAGLPASDAGAGWIGVGGGASARYEQNETFALTGALRAVRFTGDAAASPIVADRGERHQIIAAFGIEVGF